MGFLGKLFAGGSQDLQDEQLGIFNRLSKNSAGTIWKGTAKFLGETVTIYITGTETALDKDQKNAILAILAGSDDYGKKCNDSLRMEFLDAEKPFSTWQDHFTVLSVSTADNESVITFEEKETFYHFNVIFDKGQAVGVTIDS